MLHWAHQCDHSVSYSKEDLNNSDDIHDNNEKDLNDSDKLYDKDDAREDEVWCSLPTKVAVKSIIGWPDLPSSASPNNNAVTSLTNAHINIFCMLNDKRQLYSPGVFLERGSLLS